MPHLSLLVLALSVLVLQIDGLSVGTQLVRDYGSYISMPITLFDAMDELWEPQTQGQKATNSCIPALGIPFTLGSANPTTASPITLFFTPAGQLSGVGVTIYGNVFANLVETGFYQQVAPSQYFISVTFRNASDVCSTKLSSLPLGDSLIVNANSIAFNIPPSNPAASNWIEGACFADMGIHYFYDLVGSLATPPKMSFTASNLLPVIGMYNNGVINAIFFTTTVKQQSLFSGNMWDGIALTDSLMCDNWCTATTGTCSWPDASVFSTMHLFLGNYTAVTCPNNCKISCCNPV